MKKFFFLAVAMYFCGALFFSNNALAGSCDNYRGTCVKATSCPSGTTHSALADDDCRTFSGGEICCTAPLATDCKQAGGVCRDSCNANEATLGSVFKECKGVFGKKQCCIASSNATGVAVAKGQGDYCSSDPECKAGLVCSGIFFKTCEKGDAAASGTAPLPIGSTGSPVSVPMTGGWNLGDISGFGLPSASVSNITGNLLNWLLGILATVGVIGFVISGILYLVSTGDETMIDRAKAAMTWSIVGVIVGLSGVIIIQAVDWALNGFGGF